MNDAAMRELAQHIRRTHDIREASYVAGTRSCPGWYAKSYDAAAREAMVPEVLQPLIFAMLVSGFADVHQWADHILDLYGEDVSEPGVHPSMTDYAAAI